jgi:hypothetical protein
MPREEFSDEGREQQEKGSLGFGLPGSDHYGVRRSDDDTIHAIHAIHERPASQGDDR